VQWRPLREKPMRSPAQNCARLEWCSKRQTKTAAWWNSAVDLYIDCKKYALPLKALAKKAGQRTRVRGAYRKRAEGLQAHLTKPSLKKHRVNPGAHVWVLGGICGDKVVLWEYITERWRAEVAAACYRGAIKQCLQKHRPLGPGKASWLIVEDNDPAGICAIEFRAFCCCCLQSLVFALYTHRLQERRRRGGQEE
jgi:hypothetical protein